MKRLIKPTERNISDTATVRRKLSNSVKPTVIAIGSEVDEGLRDRIKTAIGVDLWN